MKKHIKKIIALLLAIVVTVSVIMLLRDDKASYEQNIKPPVSIKDIPFDTYTFDVDSGIIIKRNTGTMVKIAPGSLVDSSGQMIKGLVNLSVREFHDVESLFYSGIPMSIDVRRENFLQSAGMIELRAESNGKKVDFAKNAAAEIELASFKEAKNYQLYHLKEDQNWSVTDTFISKINIRKSEALEQLDQKYKTRREDLYLDLVTNLDQSPYLKPYTGIQWKVASKDVTEELLDAMRMDWDEVKVIPPTGLNKKYQLDFKGVTTSYNDTGVLRTHTVKAIPIRSGKKMSRNTMLDIIGENESILVQMEDEKKRIEKESDMVNAFKIDKMGIWNVDKLMNSDDIIWANIGFDFEDKIDLNINKIVIYLMFINENSVIQYLPKDWKKVGFKKNSIVKIRAVLPGGKVVEVGSDQINTKLKINEKIIFSTNQIK
jgi:hypothetical protein